MPPVAAPPAPAAPAAAPKAAPAPSPLPAPKPAAPAPAKEAPEAEWLTEVGEDLQDLDEGKPQRVRPPKDETPPKEDDAPPALGKPKPGEKAPVAAPAEDETKGMGLPQVRKAFNELKKKVASDYEPEVTRLRAQVAELEQRQPVDIKPFEEKLTTAQKRIADQEAVIRFLKYQESEDFKTNYQKPYEDAWKNALNDLAEMDIELAEGGTRKPTENDLIRLASMRLGEARAEANRMFGDSADDVMSHVRTVRDLYQKQQTALDNEKKNAAKIAEEHKQTSSRAAAERDAAWETGNAQLAAKFPKWFAKDAEDAEGNALLDKGFAVSDMLFATGQMTPERIALLPKSFQDDIKANGRLSPKKQVELHTLIRNKAAGFDRLARRVKSLSAELEEARKTISEYEASEPPGGGSAPTGGSVTGDYLEEANAELDKLDK